MPLVHDYNNQRRYRSQEADGERIAWDSDDRFQVFHFLFLFPRVSVTTSLLHLFADL